MFLYKKSYKNMLRMHNAQLTIISDIHTTGIMQSDIFNLSVAWMIQADMYAKDTVQRLPLSLHTTAKIPMIVNQDTLEVTWENGLAQGDHTATWNKQNSIVPMMQLSSTNRKLLLSINTRKNLALIRLNLSGKFILRQTMAQLSEYKPAIISVN